MLDKEEKPYINTIAAIEYLGKSKSIVKPTALLQGVLNRAAMLGDIATLKYLKEGGVDQIPEMHMIEPLIISIENKKEDVALLLLEGSDNKVLNYSDPQTRETLLHRAALKGSSRTCSMIIAKNPELNVDAKSRDKATALHCAVFSGDLDTVKVLVDAGASMKIKNDYKNTALSLARLHNHREIQSFLENTSSNKKSGTVHEDSANDPLAPPSSSRISRIE